MPKLHYCLLTALLTAVAMPAVASATASTPKTSVWNYRYQAKSHSVFNDNRRKQINHINDLLDGKNLQKAELKDTDPEITLGPASDIGDIDGPNGELWYYTGKKDYEKIVHSEYYTEFILRSYSYTIYDSNMQEVGTITDDVHYAEDEARVVNCTLIPLVTRNFFNTDDRYEVAVSLAINTVNAGYNRYRTLAYSIGGNKTDGKDVAICTIPTLMTDAVAGAATDGKDNYYLTFSEDQQPEGDMEGNFWDWINSYKIKAVTYARATDDINGPRPILTNEIPVLQMPGDQESCPYIVTLSQGDNTYLMVQSLAEPLWEEYENPMEPTVQRENNTLNVKFYKLTPDNAQPDYTTQIQVVKSDDDDVYARYYGVGMMRGAEDILFGGLGAPANRASLYVTVEDYHILTDQAVYSYYAYNPEGNKILTYAEQVESCMSLSNLEGFNPEQMFIINDGDYTLQFVDLATGETLFTMPAYVEPGNAEEPIALRANMDRTLAGDSYEYAIECSQPYEAGANTLMQIAILKAGGELSHIEYADMGTDVQFGTVYLDSRALQPDALVKDAGRCYLLLIKHGIPGEGNTEELSIAGSSNDPENTAPEYLRIVPSESKGYLTSIIPDLYNDQHTLSVYWYNTNEDGSDALSMDRYLLPFVTESGIVCIPDNLLQGDGNVSIFSADGVKVDDSADALNTLRPGIYFLRQGNRTSKIIIK